MIRGMMFSQGVAAPGQVVYSALKNTTTTWSWVVPAGVTSISAVTVGPGAVPPGASIKRGATTLLSAGSTIGAGIGGGNGGVNGVGESAGGGGAGGYSGAGGAGANPGDPGGGGVGGAGGGGGGGVASPFYAGGLGGGVGLNGVGVSGSGGSTGGTDGGPGGDGSQLSGSGAYGAGRGAYSTFYSATGGNLRYLNGIAVTPGETLTLSVDGVPVGYLGGGPTTAGAVRIMWGGSRSYPSNALDM